LRVAALYDVHGNLPALEAVLTEVESAGVEKIVIGGDVAVGPMPRETLERLNVLGDRVQFIRGNADREAAAEIQEGMSEEARRALEWTTRQLSREQRDFLGGLPERCVLDLDGLGPTLFVHATPRNDVEIVTAATPEDVLREVLSGVEQRVVVCGHTHMQYDRLVGDVRLVNAGSVGLPYQGETGAFWALLGPGVEHRRTHYDIERTAELIRTIDYPEPDFADRYILNPPGSDEVTAYFEQLSGR
jgi:predicted phosphodiesterase